MTEINGTWYDLVPVLPAYTKGRKHHDLMRTVFEFKDLNARICIVDSSVRPYRNIRTLEKALYNVFAKLNCRYSCYCLDNNRVIIIKR